MTDSAGRGVLLDLVAPLAGWVLPLAEVPDPVFAGAMAGDGVAIDPLGESLHAPCDGVIALLGENRHALTLKGRGVDVLMHVGIDTLKMTGAGFRLQVRDGESVRAGQALMRFDLDAIVRSAPSAITPVLLTGQHPGRIVRRHSGGRVAVGEFLFQVEPFAAPAAMAAPLPIVAITQQFRVPFEHGLHARPAAQLAAALAGLDAEVSLRLRGRAADARSVVAMMALGVGGGEVVAATAHGPQADVALAALSKLLAPVPDLEPPRPHARHTGRPQPGARLSGLMAAPGFVAGIAAPLIDVEPPIGPALGDSAVEGSRLAAAIDEVSAFVRQLGVSAEGVRRGVLDAHLALLSDPQLRRDAHRALAAGASAGTAWRGALRAAAESLRASADARLAERRPDLLDIERQVLRVLAGAPPAGGPSLPANALVLAEELLPSQLLALDATRLAGLCTAGGGVTSHVAILAASMGLPTVVAAGAPVLAIAAGTPLVLDADAGVLFVDPPAADRARIDASIVARNLARDRDLAAAQQPAITRDGIAIHVYGNLGAAADAASAVGWGAEGCGLLRTEFMFLARAQAPSEDEQLAQYQLIASALDGRPLTIRTLDAGGDKPIAYLSLPSEANPALGLRGLRTSLAYPELLRAQLRAVLRIRPAGQCRVLLPMVTDLDDVRAVRAQLAQVSQELQIPAPPLGAMIETPAAAVLADQLVTECDFLSIGSNDLSQYALAIDRLHPTLAARLDGLHPSVLRLIDRAARAGVTLQIATSVCGTLAADPEAVPVLIGLGVRELSVVPALIPRLKSQLRTLDSVGCVELARHALALPNAVAVRALVREWSAGNA